MSEDTYTAPPPPPVSEADQAAIEAAKAQDAGKPKRQARKPVPAKLTKYKSKQFPLYHPYQKVTIPVAYGVPLDTDSWVEVQLNAGVIEESD